MRNHEVARAWADDKVAQGGHMLTDGRWLYSYGLKIGYTRGDGRKVAVNYTAQGHAMFSMTTSQHVSLAKRYADVVEDYGAADFYGVSVQQANATIERRAQLASV